MACVSFRVTCVSRQSSAAPDPGGDADLDAGGVLLAGRRGQGGGAVEFRLAERHAGGRAGDDRVEADRGLDADAEAGLDVVDLVLGAGGALILEEVVEGLALAGVAADAGG